MRMLLSGPFRGLPERHYRCILADPPWAFATRGKNGHAKSAERHYPTMDIDAIKALPVASVAAPDAFLWLWATGPHMRLAFDVIDAWGFTYSGLGLAWAKTTKHGKWHFGMGYGTRSNVEVCLLARRGKPKRLSASVRELMVSQVREHSRKPDETHERIEAFSAGPRLELFARQRRIGWHSWGNQTERFAPAGHASSATAAPEQTDNSDEEKVPVHLGLDRA